MMFSLLVSALVAMSHYGATAPTNDNAFDLPTYVTPPMDVMNIGLNAASTDTFGHCNVGQDYCLFDIIKTLGKYALLVSKPNLCTIQTLTSQLGYPLDQILYQYCRENPSDEYSCLHCGTYGCSCGLDCVSSVFECMDNDDWYKHRRSCAAEAKQNGTAMSCGFGQCYKD